jgi:hypothetical protein
MAIRCKKQEAREDYLRRILNTYVPIEATERFFSQDLLTI